MKLESVTIKNYRGISEAIIPFDRITTFVGQNDVGKSSILAALDLFFNDKNICEEDINRSARRASGVEASVDAEVSCVFSGPWLPLMLDDRKKTKMERECLLRDDGKLELRKIYRVGVSTKVFVVCHVVNDDDISKLFTYDNQKLKSISKKYGCACRNYSDNVALRTAIRKTLSKGKITENVPCLLTGSRLDGVLKILPRYEFFQADRENMSDDNAVLFPMKAAVRVAFESKKVLRCIERVESIVRAELETVMEKTQDALKSFDEQLAKTLRPDFSSPPLQKWCDVFRQFTLKDEDGIPLDNRGSGVRRMVLLSFLQGEAKRKMDVQNRGVIFAIEEPETAQHSDNQRVVANALLTLSGRVNTQVVLTTHSGNMLKQLAKTRICTVLKKENRTCVEPIELRDEKKMYLPQVSLVEIAYLLLGDCVPEYHSEMFGFIERNGLNLEKWCRDMVKNGHAEYMLEFSRANDKKEALHPYPVYVRDRLHHPENPKYLLKGEEEIRKSIEMMRLFMREEGEKQLQYRNKACLC